MWLLFALDQRGRGVDPRHGAMQQKIAHGEISHLARTDHKTDLFTGRRVRGTQIALQASVLMPLPLFSSLSVR